MQSLLTIFSLGANQLFAFRFSANSISFSHSEALNLQYFSDGVGL
jgi:hypothetical protein